MIKIKIAYFSNSIIPSTSANSLHVMKMCQALAENGHEVILLAPDKGEKINGSIYDFYGVKENFKIKKISTPNIKGKTYLYAFKSAIEALKNKVDLCYGRFIISCYFSQLLNLPTIYEAHGTINTKSENYMFKSIIKSKSFVRFISMSEYLKDKYMTEYNLSERQIQVAYNGADRTDKFERVQFYNDSQIQVGYVGNLYEGKGMEIVSELVKNASNCHFHIIGGNNEDVEKWKIRFTEYDNVTFYGFLPHSHTIKYRNSFDILLCPTKSSVSVFGAQNKKFNQKNSPPIKIFEYMESGRAMIASDFLDEVLEDGRNAILCPEDDIGEWETSLQRLSNDQDLRNYLGSEAEMDFINKYTWFKRAKKVLGE